MTGTIRRGFAVPFRLFVHLLCGSLVDITLERQELAEMAAVTSETLIRLLGAVRDEKALRTTGKAIILLNPEALARIARA